MVYCQVCGAELDEGAEYCSSCGASVSEPRVVTRQHRTRDRREGCFGSSGSGEACFGPPGSGTGLWGAISGGIFLIGLAVLWFYDYWWPGLLFLIAIMMIIGGIVAYTRR